MAARRWPQGLWGPAWAKPRNRIQQRTSDWLARRLATIGTDERLCWFASLHLFPFLLLAVAIWCMGKMLCSGASGFCLAFNCSLSQTVALMHHGGCSHVVMIARRFALPSHQSVCYQQSLVLPVETADHQQCGQAGHVCRQ